MHYSDDQLRNMLDEAGPNLAAEDLQHLDECTHCQQRLASLSGEGPWLDDWASSVGEVTCEQVHRHPNSVVVTVDTSDGLQSELQCDKVNLDFLETPRHPELLGRLGRYDIERLVGMGGYGIVFKAYDTELNRVVAIKVLAPHLMNSGPARKRFAREAQAAAAVVHDHVVPIYDVVVDESVSYFVMQFIPGESLQERVDKNGPLPTPDVLRIASQIAAGLQAAHAQGLIHRDVKPGNVLLAESVNRVMISDFGLARASDDASLTRSGTITGTPHYMSPEQARGMAVDARSDLFSLGSLIYFMCAGRSPFRADQMMAVLNRICHEPHRPLEEVNPQVPLELTKIVDRLLSKSADKRLATAEDVHLQMNALLSDYEHGRLRPARRRRAVKLPSSLGTWAAGIVCLVAICATTYFMRPDTASTSNPPRSPNGETATLEWSRASGSMFDRAEEQFTFQLGFTRDQLESFDQQYRGSGFRTGPSVWYSDLNEVATTLDDLERQFKQESLD